MSGQLDAVDAKRHTADLICAIFGSEFDGRMRTTGELRLAVLDWVLNLEGDPAIAAKLILMRKADSHVAALPLTVIAILHEIARGDLARFQRRGRRAKRRVAN
jgi:hypothetical protein